MQPFPNNIPLQQIHFDDKVKLFALRLDTIDHYGGGNKYFKLKYNLEEAKKLGHEKILTFGGAWSNHLAALASIISAQRAEGFKQPEVIGVIRGEEPKELSDTLRFCKEKGMQLHFISRENYRRKNEAEFINDLKKKFGDFYLLPEGGSNELAVKGCREITDLIKIDFDTICCPVGSGGTFAGIVSGLKPHQKALGFVALKGAEYLEDVITKLMHPPRTASQRHSPQGEIIKNFDLLYEPHPASPGLSTKREIIKTFDLLYEYHFGGFAKTTPGLLVFKKDFEKKFGFELDYIYTAKMFYGISDLLQKGYFKKGETIVALHTGGLQGNKGFET